VNRRVSLLQETKHSRQNLSAPDELIIYAGLCGWTLARAHARSGDRVQIAAYLGKSDRFDRAIADFAKQYADQNERDHEALCAAVKAGRLYADAGT
jgi:sugar/nucleoside kinase (ribokinase family)